jgi:hypothetical protein
VSDSEQLDRIREMLGVQGVDDVAGALGEYLAHLERLAYGEGDE